MLKRTIGEVRFPAVAVEMESADSEQVINKRRFFRKNAVENDSSLLIDCLAAAGFLP